MTAGSAIGPVVLERHDARRNMHRVYTLSVEATLFEDWSCTRRFGRCGQARAGGGGRVMIGLYESRAEALAAMERLLRAKGRRGYRRV